MLKAQLRRGFRDMRRLVRIDPARHAGLDVAESAGAGAGIAKDHDRRMLLGPALPDVRAGGFLADRVEFQVPHQLACFAIALGGRGLYPDPVRLALALGLGFGLRDRGQIVHPAQIVACARPCQPEYPG